MYWKKKKTLPTIKTRTNFPIGTFVHTPKGYYYIAGTNKRFRFITKRSLNSWSPHRIVEATEEALSNYKITAKMKFRNGSLIHNISDGKIYLISEGKRRHITNPDSLTTIGAQITDVVSVSLNEIRLHELGEPL